MAEPTLTVTAPEVAINQVIAAASMSWTNGETGKGQIPEDRATLRRSIDSLIAARDSAITKRDTTSTIEVGAGITVPK